MTAVSRQTMSGGTDIRPFHVNVPETELGELRRPSQRKKEARSQFLRAPRSLLPQ